MNELLDEMSEWVLDIHALARKAEAPGPKPNAISTELFRMYAAIQSERDFWQQLLLEQFPEFDDLLILDENDELWNSESLL